MDATKEDDEESPLPASWHHPDQQQQQHSADQALLPVHPNSLFAVGPGVVPQPPVSNPSVSSPSPFFAVGPGVDAQPQAAPNPSSYPPSGLSITTTSNPSSYLLAAPNPSSDPSSGFPVTAASNQSSYPPAAPPSLTTNPPVSNSHSAPTPAFHDPYRERAFLATMDAQIAVIAAYIKKSNNHIKKGLLRDLEAVLERRVTELAAYNRAPQGEDGLRALELCNRLVERLQEEVALMREAHHPTQTAEIMEHYRGLYVAVKKRRVVLDGGSSDQELEEEIAWKKRGLAIA